MSCFDSAVWMALLALMDLSLLPVSPKIRLSRSVATMCSSCTVRVPVSQAVSTDLTRHTMPLPGSVSSCSQRPRSSSGSSGPSVMAAVLTPASTRLRLMEIGVNRSSGSRLLPTNSSIYTYLP